MLNDVADAKLFSAKFIQSCKRVYNLYKAKTIGLPFVFIPGFTQNSLKILNIASSTLYSVVQQLIDDFLEKNKVKQLIDTLDELWIGNINSKVTSMLVLRARALNSLLMRKYGYARGLEFSSVISFIVNFLNGIYTIFNNDNTQLEVFYNFVLDTLKFIKSRRYLPQRIAKISTTITPRPAFSPVIPQVTSYTPRKVSIPKTLECPIKKIKIQPPPRVNKTSKRKLGSIFDFENSRRSLRNKQLRRSSRLNCK